MSNADWREALEAAGELTPPVVGHHDEYIVEDGACTCKDASYNLDPADPEQRCWHAIAVDVAERIGAVDSHDLWYSDVRDLLE